MKTWQIGAATVSVVLALCGSSASAQVADDAAAVLKESAKEITQLKGLRYKSKIYGVGALAALIDGDGEVKQLRGTGDAKRAPMWAKGQVAEPGKGKAQFEVMTDGKIIAWLDAPANVLYKRAFVDRTDQTRNLSRGQQLILGELAEPNPFSKELKADKLEIAGATDVHGEACQIVKATWAGERSFTWYISVVDHLPRKFEQAFGGGKDALAKGTEIWEVKTDELKPKDLEIPLPNGFKVDEQIEAPKGVNDANAPQPPQAQQQPMPDRPVPALGRGGVAPDFELSDSNGQPVKLGSNKGNVVVLSFWSSLFPKSDANNKVAQEIYDSYKGKGVKVYGLACRETAPQNASTKAKEQNLTFPIVPQADAVSSSYKVTGFPSLCVVDKDGKVTDFIQGVATKEQVIAAVEAALAGKPLEVKKEDPAAAKAAPPVAPAPVPTKEAPVKK